MIGARNVPPDVASDSDPYVKLKLIDAKTRKKKGKTVMTQWRKNVADPFWYTYRNLQAKPEPGDTLRVSVGEVQTKHTRVLSYVTEDYVDKLLSPD